MSKTIRNGSDFPKDRENAQKQKVPTPYPPVEPTVAQKNKERTER